jgi:hypothetical protein
VAGYMRGGRVEMLPRDKTLVEAGDKLVLLSDEAGEGSITLLKWPLQFPRLTCDTTW